MRLTKVLVLLAAAQFFWAGALYAQEDVAKKERHMGGFSEGAGREIDHNPTNQGALNWYTEKTNALGDLRWFGIEEDDSKKWGEGNQEPGSDEEATTTTTQKNLSLPPRNGSTCFRTASAALIPY